MFLKSLDIFGFKSFADRTHIDFVDGVTALLGPNGCGKSNVVDAIKWVLGEQATKSLRAEAMEDVIFNGTEGRKAVNVAEVALTLSNENKQLTLDMPEVVVKRRLYRSGESEYYINSTPVKLKDLRELFFDTGIGKSAYSIMEQGKIDQVLSHKPEERRNLFEEAASITKHKMKGAEAERKLEKTDENMRQVEGILGEVKRTYDSLKKQSEKTLRYRTVRDEVFGFEVKLQLIRLREATEERERRRKLQEELHGNRDAIKLSIDTVNETLEENLGEVSTMEARLLEVQKSLYTLEIEKNNNENQIRLFQERIHEIRQKIAADQARDDGIARKMLAIQEDNAQRRKTVEDLGKGLLDIESNINRLETMVEHARNRISQNEAETLDREGLIIDCDAVVETIQKELGALTDSIVSQLDASLSDGANASQERKRLEQAVRDELETITIHLEGRKAIIEDAQRLGESASSRAIEAARSAIQELLVALERLSGRFDAFTLSIPSFLDEFLAPEGTLTQKRDLDSRLENLRKEVQDHRKTIGELREEKDILSRKIVESRDNLEELRVSKVRLGAQVQALQEQEERSRLELSELDVQRMELQGHMAEDNGRVKGLEERIIEFQRLKEKYALDEKENRKLLAELEKGINSRNKAVLSKERELKDKVVKLSAFQEKLEKAQIAFAESQAEIKNMYANFRDRHSRDLQEFEQGMYEVREDARLLRDKLAELKEELKTLGSVNLMAVEEFAEVKERFDFLHGQLEDLRKAKDDLIKVTSEIRNESSALFLETYEKIRRNFHNLFRRLFGGGRGELKLSDPHDVLESGIEIYAQPPGKKLENIALLSGGERSLTAVALLFATYMVKPSPFCLLDEIDAALDENNVGRFVTMLMEFAHTSQFIVITHNKKTVTGARSLLGVTMQESGVSKVVAIRIAEEERRADYRAVEESRVGVLPGEEEDEHGSES